MSTEGRYEYATGEVHEGEYALDMVSGHGRLTFTNGDVYEGSFANNMIHGEGTYKFANGDTYQGARLALIFVLSFLMCFLIRKL